MRGVTDENKRYRIAVHDRRRAVLTAAVGFALLPSRSDQREVGMLRRWLDTWTGLGLVVVGMARQGYDLQLTRYAEQGWRANFHAAGIAHSVVVGSGWAPTPWRAVQRAAWAALCKATEAA
jgi:hypothetical protein